MDASPVLEPIGDVISQRANDANCKAGPEDAEQQHPIRALYKFLVDQMGHTLPLFKSPPVPCAECNACPPGSAKPAAAHQGCNSRVAQPLVYTSFTRLLTATAAVPHG